MRRKKLLSWGLSIVMALTIFCIPVGGVYAEEAADGDFCLQAISYDEVNEEEVRANLDSEINYSDYVSNYDRFLSQEIAVSRYSEGYGWSSHWNAGKLVWHNSDPSVAGIEITDTDWEPYVSYDKDIELLGYEDEEGYMSGPNPSIRVVPKKAGSVDLSVDVYSVPDYDPEFGAIPAPVYETTLQLKVNISDEFEVHYCLASVVYNDNPEEDNTYIPYGEEINYNDMSNDDDFFRANMVLCSDEYEGWHSYWGAKKIVWHNQTPGVAAIMFQNEDNDDIVSSDKTIELEAGENNEINPWFNLVPKAGGTAILSIDVYNEKEAADPVATIPLSVEIKTEEVEKARYEKYLNWNEYIIDGADYDDQEIFGMFPSLEEYNENVDTDSLKIQNEEVENIKINATVGEKEYKGTPHYSYGDDMWDYSISFAKAAPGTKVKVTYTMGSYSKTEETVVSQYVEPKITVTSRIYNGKVQKPTVTVSVGKTVLKKGVDYDMDTVSRKDVGGQSFEIWSDIWTNPNAKYKFWATRTFNINPKGTSLGTLKKGKKEITVKWTKQAAKMSKTRITGYQIQLATNKGFTKNKKLVTVKGYSTVSKKVKKLKKKTKYFVRVRTYKTVSGKNYYSAWSKVKSIKTK